MFGSACGKKANKDFLHAATEFDKSVPKEQKEKIQNDLIALHDLELQPEKSARFQQVLKIGDIQPSSLISWLGDRVRFWVGESFNDFSTKEKAQGDAVTLMQNLGAALFREGVEQGEHYWATINDKSIPMNTPRIGLVQIGEGLFYSIADEPDLEAQEKIDRFFRYSVYFHEARHSDGSGPDNAGLPHVQCPKGHDYEDEWACDGSTNGSYTIGAELLYSIYNSCKDCSDSILETLKLAYADSASRIMPGSHDLDDTPEEPKF